MNLVAHELGEVALSWIRAMRADGDGPPNWFWPAAQTGTFLGLQWLAALRADNLTTFVVGQTVALATFCGGNLVVWLGYRGWKWYRLQKEPTQGEATT